MPITPPGWRTASGGVAVGAGEVSGDQRLGELLLARHELDTVRLELVMGCTALVQGLPLCDEHADRALEGLDASH